MHDLKGRTAVITGAASGIGFALAQRAAREGMRLVLADIDEAKLAEAARTLPRAADALVIRRVDVSREADIAALADTAFARFGAVHLLCNNAGVGLTRLAWEMSTADWEWVLGVNLWSVVHAIHHFVPRMLAQADESRIVNTASVAGLLSTPAMAAYNVSKHGVVTLSETLYAELKAQQAKIGVSVLCPAWVPTAIQTSERNRPERFGTAAPPSAASAAYHARMDQAVKSGRLTADDMAGAVFDAVAAGRFYVIPHTRIKQAVRLRMEDILEDRNPTPL
ncbi:MAG: short-chain type dehydrogenase/reductase [Candidatus Desulfobacillus denitrificans]|jgi:NAD(P)-dependent dehydrogenase (short-subunit alcohol dehydrogenase family)|uniref:Short-chain dehydrogenase n=1 Tax=Candidatus Desulfobacillus denitrificans TaxID=2608985 RepID=A0A809QZ19_9PROT|nr:SDR family NAD(P)-dependent oxidoreductase [Rhodocyclaceae bacterium]MCZ2173389.1 SDR family NAD(P)-dependent oxidoreductase [Burkholderiales bacterium]OQY69421.1 MAG: short-chain dehydrogenase [Rhodocyclaceae bacterium UTPRO2]BBO20639.1 short-chain dehydrogenase [Candidatus Desulfobacillus denitrificans]GIK44207.1 MAG: short-chain dehydrogenase [Betaproteobacteria bacterium]